MVNLIDSLSQKSKSLLLILGIIAVIPIGVLNSLMGVEIYFSILYLILVALVSWCGGKREGGFIALASSVTWYVANWAAGREYSHPFIYTGKWPSCSDFSSS